jgi:hypothetical protein
MLFDSISIKLMKKSGVFWGAVVKQWPMPFSLGDLVGAVLTMDGNDELMLIVVQSERVDGADCVKVQLKNRCEEATRLAVMITREGEFVSGMHANAPVDETGAVNALALYQSCIRGEWQYLPA